MTTCPTNSPARHACARRLARAALFTAALALAASPLVHPAIARAGYDDELYESCLAFPGRSNASCCALANGVLDSRGICMDPASTSTPAPQPTTITQRPLVPVFPITPRT